MKLQEYIKKNYNTNTAFADANGLSNQQVSQMVIKGTYYVYDEMLVIARRKLKKTVIQ